MGDLVSLNEFATIIGASEPTVRKVMKEAVDFPVVSVGKNGEAYQIDADVAVAWWKARDEAAKAEQVARAEFIRSKQFELLGPDAALAPPDDGLSPAEKSAQLDAEIKAIKLGRERGQLVRMTDVEATAAQFMATVQQLYASLTDRLRRLSDLEPATAEALDRLVARDLNQLADAAERIRDLTLEEQRASTDSAVPAGG